MTKNWSSDHFFVVEFDVHVPYSLAWCNYLISMNVHSISNVDKAAQAAYMDKQWIAKKGCGLEREG